MTEADSSNFIEYQHTVSALEPASPSYAKDPQRPMLTHESPAFSPCAKRSRPSDNEVNDDYMAQLAKRCRQSFLLDNEFDLDELMDAPLPVNDENDNDDFLHLLDSYTQQPTPAPHVTQSCQEQTNPSHFMNSPRDIVRQSAAVPIVTATRKPKGYVSAFNFFAKYARSCMRNQWMGLSNNEINVNLGAMWHDLPASEVASFEQQALNDKIRYIREVWEYNLVSQEKITLRIDPPPGYGVDGRLLSEGGIPVTASTTDARQRTAYSLFANQEREYVVRLDCPEIRRQMGKYFSHRWRTMDPEEKRLYVLLEQSGATVSKKKSPRTSGTKEKSKRNK